jgi:hypothetical protein
MENGEGDRTIVYFRFQKNEIALHLILVAFQQSKWKELIIIIIKYFYKINQLLKIDYTKVI